jgi:TPR repeat protein
MRAGSVCLSLFFLLVSGIAVRADYAEGQQAFARGDYPRAVATWRKAAWISDDLNSEKKLGELYSKGQYAKYDPVEAYVWLYLAIVNSAHLSNVKQVRDGERDEAFQAIKVFDELALQMASAERRDAELRIVYILSSRGAEGFVKLGQLYAEQALFDECQPQFTDPLLKGIQGYEAGVRLDDRGGYLDQTNNNLVADPSQYLFCGPQQDALADLNTSALEKNSVDAYAYFLLAQERGYDAAAKIADAYRTTLSSGKIGFGRVTSARKEVAARARAAQIIQKAMDFAVNWEPPFEVYPGGHSDESPFNYERAKALSLVAKEIKVASIQDALGYIGFYEGPADGAWGAATHAAMGRYQAFLGHSTSGELRPEDVVLLIKTAATRGQARAQERLGEMYYRGIGEPQNYARAKHWFEMAADQREPFALYNLGIMSRDGLGTEIDFDQARVYFTKARRANPGQPLLENINKQLEALETDSKDTNSKPNQKREPTRE